MRNHIIILIIACLLLSICRVSTASLAITEIMFSTHYPDSNPDQYWWELTNLGSDVINLNGYSWDDSSAQPGEFIFPNMNIVPSESIIILQHSATVSDFESVWGLAPGSIQILVPLDFGVSAFPGFSINDTINIFSPSPDNNLVDSKSGIPGNTTQGISIEYLPGLSIRSSVPGENGAYIAPGITPDEVGSPGVVPEPCSITLLGLGGLTFIRKRQ